MGYMGICMCFCCFIVFPGFGWAEEEGHIVGINSGGVELPKDPASFWGAGLKLGGTG